ncbi:MAG: helix-turn-helix domain-containing protein [Actinomycetota bacterium]|nr:helix-turn-helix domain-containing protein [Actinomycetota bacterium]
MQRTVLARRVGVAENTIYRIETGKRTPSVELLEKIARELRTEPAELLRELAEPVGAGKDEAPSPGPNTGAGLTLDEVLAERRFLDYRRCREALDRFCEYWEQALTEDRLDRRACEEFHAGAELASELLRELWSAERVELRLQRGEDPQSVDKSEPWPPDLMEKSELWPAIDRWMRIGLQVHKIAKEHFGEDAPTDAGVVDLREHIRRKAG